MELVEGGAAIEVTDKNVEEYVGRMLYHEVSRIFEPQCVFLDRHDANLYRTPSHKVRGRTERGTIAFCNGFWEAPAKTPKPNS